MKMQLHAFLILAAMLAIRIVTGINVAADPAVSIELIEESALDGLLQDADNHLVITFMAAWCKPCIDELPVLNELYQKYKLKGLDVVGISIDAEGPAAMQPIADTLKIEFPIFWYGEKAVKKFKLNMIPMLFFVRNGEIVEKLHGHHSRNVLEKKIKKFLR